MFLSEWREFPSPPCLAGKKELVTTHVSMLLKSRESLTCFVACFLLGRAKDLSAPDVGSLVDDKLCLICDVEYIMKWKHYSKQCAFCCFLLHDPFNITFPVTLMAVDTDVF